MPIGVRGFQKGRPKTGGSITGAKAAARRSSKFVEQLKGFGFNYPQELADILKELKSLRTLSEDPQKRAQELVRAAELKYYYAELKSLLPYMAPKLREKEIEVETLSEPADPTAEKEKPITDADLLKTLDDDKQTLINTRTSRSASMAERDSALQVSTGSEENLPNVAGEQTEDE